jgi:UDP-N-acetylglucosamine 4-epimerase
MFNQNLYNTKFHNLDISKYSYLITGGAGFIGSNLVEYLLKYGAGHVRVLDNLSNGYIENIKDFQTLPNFEFIQGDIRDINVCYSAFDNIDFVSHQAALGSVPRSINNPILTNEVNVSGFLNILTVAKESKKIKKFVYAASSSTYGDSILLPKVEGTEGKPLSPYAVTKLVNEIYADVFSKVYNFNSIGLRYFNIFGPKQNPKNPYAAVIPIFCSNFLEDKNPQIFGDGQTSRDFTFVENAIQANIKAFELEIKKSEIFNVACGNQVTLLEIIESLKKISNKYYLNNEFLASRTGDIKHSKASIEKITNYMNYANPISFDEGLKIVYNYYQDYYKIF